MEQWAEIRRMHFVEKLAIKEIARRTGKDRKTIRRAIRSSEPPRYRRPQSASKLDPHREQIADLLANVEGINNTRIRELISEAGYRGSKTILDDYLRELRPVLCPKRTYQRTSYRPGELLQFDIFEPRREIPVGHGQTRRGYLVTCELGFSRAAAGALVFSKRFEDIAWGMSRCLRFLGALPETLVWDREGAIHDGRGGASEPFAAFCGRLAVGWRILQARDPESKGALERTHRFLRSNFEPARSFANPIDFQGQLDRWFSERANLRFHRGIRAVPAERLAQERGGMRPLPDPMPATVSRRTLRVPQQPYFRFDSNDYSLDPRFAGGRVELHLGQRQLVAIALSSGELLARHRRSFAKHLTFTDPAHQRELDRLRGRRRRGPAVDVERRPLARYDELIPA
ncbi:MAG: IS21 family transposase [Solirubrobacteraceae bacterium]